MPIDSCHQALWERIAAHRFDDPAARLTFSGRLARENGWTIGHAVRVVDEYRRFVFLAMTAGRAAVSPVAAGIPNPLDLTGPPFLALFVALLGIGALGGTSHAFLQMPVERLRTGSNSGSGGCGTDGDGGGCGGCGGGGD